MLDDEGGFLAPTAAERLVAERFTVEIASTHPVVGAEIDPTQQPFALRRLALAGVAMTPHLSGVSSDADGVTLRNVYTPSVTSGARAWALWSWPATAVLSSTYATN